MDQEFYKTKETVEQYIKAAKGFNGKLLIDKLIKILPANSTVLEIGSGPGTDWNILKKNYKVIGSDNSKEFIKYLTKENPDGNFLLLDAVTLKTDISFDAIYSNKVLHHLNDDEILKSIKNQSELLKNRGIICHSFWKGEGSEVFNGLHVNYHSENSLKEIFQKYFNVLSIETYQEFDKGDSILLIGQKKK